MGLFKKDEEVPAIPTAPSLPSLPSIKEESIKRDLPELPSFPTSSRNENLNQEMVKSAISDAPSPGEAEPEMKVPESFSIPEPKNDLAVPFSNPIQSIIPDVPKSAFSRPQKTTGIPTAPEETLKQNEPVFIRIDKFQVAQESFEEIKSKVVEIESILQKVKEIKVQEEEELKGWTEDVEKLKSQLTEIDGNIFSQL